MRVGILGGGLQGVELCWLGRQTGWDITLVDRRPSCPARHLASHFLHADLARLPRKAAARLRGLDLLIPATENPAALSQAVRLCQAWGLPLAFDPCAYALTSSKLRSRELFVRQGTPIPSPVLPQNTTFPLLAKPSAGSGSQGVRVFHTEETLRAVFPLGVQTPHWIFERYCPGPSCSVEVCGQPGNYHTFALTALFMDEVFDCKRVTAPCALPRSMETFLRREAVRLAEALQLRGLMDVEVILTSEGPRVLEIDARFPSQTPTAVFLSTGVNLAEHLAACFVPGVKPAPALPHPRHCVYEHVRVQDRMLRTQGEHGMTLCGPLRLEEPYYGADAALVGTKNGAWAATLLFSDTCPHKLRQRRDLCHTALMQAHECAGQTDPCLPADTSCTRSAA